MADNTTKSKTAQPLAAIPRLPARVARGAGIGFLVLLTLLHLVKPEFDPSWHFISEYAIGSFGWLMMLAFLTLAAGYVGLFAGALLDLTPFAAPLIAWSLARHNPNWAPAKRVLWWSAGLPFVGLAAFSAATVVMAPDGRFGPDVLVGWPNRFLIVTYCVWLVTMAWQALQLRRSGTRAPRSTSRD